MTSILEKKCIERGLRMTDQRRIIAKVLSDANDHPDAEEVYARATAIDPKISLATVYRTVRLFDEAGIIETHDFRDGRARYELAEGEHHDHLIDVQTGDVIEFVDEEIERLQEKIAEKLGYELVDHRMELYGRKKK
ncbi:Fur family transcriptional regulator [Litorimonas sp. WD9-15]|uniref:Fur family transcriptional regulator n=1 Tax=Litorimonas sp. WD9-15 TaxID=3418716 RepID=UPI003D030A2C